MLKKEFETKYPREEYLNKKFYLRNQRSTDEPSPKDPISEELMEEHMIDAFKSKYFKETPEGGLGIFREAIFTIEIVNYTQVTYEEAESKLSDTYTEQLTKEFYESYYKDSNFLFTKDNMKEPCYVGYFYGQEDFVLRDIDAGDYNDTMDWTQEYEEILEAEYVVCTYEEAKERTAQADRQTAITR